MAGRAATTRLARAGAISLARRGVVVCPYAAARQMLLLPRSNCASAVSAKEPRTAALISSSSSCFSLSSSAAVVDALPPGTVMRGSSQLSNSAARRSLDHSRFSSSASESPPGSSAPPPVPPSPPPHHHRVNPPDATNPDPVTLQDQWRYATRMYSTWYAHAWGTAILAGVSFFGLGWFIKGENPLHFGSKEKKQEVLLKPE